MLANNKDHALRQLLRPLYELLNDSEIIEIRINRPFEVVTQTPYGKKYHHVEVLTLAYLRGLSAAIQTYNGLGNEPQLYAMLPDGQRVTILKPPAVLEGVISIIIRKHSLVTKNLESLVRDGIFRHCKVMGQLNCAKDPSENHPLHKHDEHLLELINQGFDRFLTHAVLYKKNIVIAGKTGSGKTTLARSLIECIPIDERLVTIEDVHELLLPNHQDKIHLLYGANQGRLSATDCIMSCMRLSPDRILLAELRGDEAWDYITSLNTGHPGSITTTHANSATHTFNRISTLVKQSPNGISLDVNTLERVLYQTIDLVIYMHQFQVEEIWFDPFLKTKLSINLLQENNE